VISRKSGDGEEGLTREWLESKAAAAAEPY
jgi:hypothetical protein